METYRRALEQHMVGQRLHEIQAARAKRLNRAAAELSSLLRGCRIARIDRRGKSLAIVFDAPIPMHILYVHLMLGGRISFDIPDQPAAVALVLADGRSVSFHLGLGRIDALTEAELTARWEKLGVEPLSPEWHPDILPQAFSRTQRPLKTCLMDQTVVAGIGNVYSDEICYRAQLYPGTPAAHLTADDWRRIAAALLWVLKEALDWGGVGPPLDQSDGRTGRYRQHLAVHYRAGLPCGQTGVVVIEPIGGRTSYWCPSVQTRR